MRAIAGKPCLISSVFCVLGAKYFALGGHDGIMASLLATAYCVGVGCHGIVARLGHLAIIEHFILTVGGGALLLSLLLFWKLLVLNA